MTEKLEKIQWIMVCGLSVLFGLTLAIAPSIVMGAVLGIVPAIEGAEAKTLFAIIVLPTVLLWVASAPLLLGRPPLTFVLAGIAWPFIALVIGANLNSTISESGSDLYMKFASLLYWLALPLGTTAGFVLSKVIGCPSA